MNTRELCLGALHLGDASGYEIKQKFEQAFRHFQKVSYGSIYPALGALAAEGLVDCKVHAQDGRPDKKTYTLTASGRETFRRVLIAAQPTESFQSDFLVLILFARHLPRWRMREVVASYLQSLQAQRHDLQQLLDTDPDCHRPGEASFTIEFGIAAISASIDFIQHHQTRLIEMSPDHD